MRPRPEASILVIVIALLGATTAGAALRPVVSEKIADVTVRILVEGGQLLVGRNDVALELSPSAGRVDATEVTLVKTQLGAGPPQVNVSLLPDGPGRFHGAMTLSSTANCRLQVTWQDDRGPHSHAVTVPVVVGHH